MAVEEGRGEEGGLSRWIPDLPVEASPGEGLAQVDLRVSISARGAGKQEEKLVVRGESGENRGARETMQIANC